MLSSKYPSYYLTNDILKIPSSLIFDNVIASLSVTLRTIALYTSPISDSFPEESYNPIIFLFSNTFIVFVS